MGCIHGLSFFAQYHQVNILYSPHGKNGSADKKPLILSPHQGFLTIQPLMLIKFFRSRFSDQTNKHNFMFNKQSRAKLLLALGCIPQMLSVGEINGTRVCSGASYRQIALWLGFDLSFNITYWLSSNLNIKVAKIYLRKIDQSNFIHFFISVTPE